MAKHIKQIIVTQDNISKELLNEKEKVSVLGIQGAPGTLFSINNGGNMVISEFGSYEIDLSQFDSVITSIKILSSNSNVIVDMLYE